jgi:hypothetical protein
MTRASTASVGLAALIAGVLLVPGCSRTAPGALHRLLWAEIDEIHRQIPVIVASDATAGTVASA